MSLLDNLIKDAINEHTFLDVNRAGFESDIIFGVILQESEEFLCIKKFNEYGEYDGISIIRKVDITFIGIGGNQRTVIEKLVGNHKEFNSEIKLDLATIYSVIESISAQFGYLSLYEENYSEDFYLGQVLRIDDEYLIIHEYGTKKALDRSKALLRLDSITRIEADGKYEKSILQTFSNK